jgi:2,4-dienoyl-CoA reductase-like NADH-dependent reductase (Old Yellow Enzyme family)
MRSATCESVADASGSPQRPLFALLSKLADGEVGLIVPGAVYALPAGQGLPYQTGAHTAALCSAWLPILSAIHRTTSSKIIFQICYAATCPGALTPSGVSPDTRPMSMSDIDDVVQSFVTAAARLKAAGADGVQLHGAHGFLLSQFLSPVFNRRTDRYGLDRAAIVRDIAAETRRATGPDFVLGIKLNGDDYVPGGVTPELAGGYVRELQPLFDFFEVSSGKAPVAVLPDFIRKKFPPERADEIIKMQTAAMEGVPFTDGFNVPAARVIHRIAPEAKLAIVGGIRRWELISQIVAEGTATLVSMSRPFIRQPDLVKVLRKEGTHADCVSCSLCRFTEKPPVCLFPPTR